MLDDRKLAVLRAIVQDFVSTEEPVGSKTLVDRHNLGVSPATIRNDMAALEEEGYIAQPHTSAGRVPTDKGYRLFVDRLGSVRPLSPAERRAIQQFLDSAVNLDDVVDRTVRLLAQLTRQVAVVQYPSLSGASVRHLELLSTGPGRVMLVLITDTGRVEQRVVEVPVVTSEHLLPDLRARLNTAMDGQRLVTAAAAVAGLVLPVEDQAVDGTVVRTIVGALQEMIDESRDQRVVLAGAANLARAGHDFPDSLQLVLEALEEQVVLMRLLNEAATPEVGVRIGAENSLQSLAGASVVASGYGSGEVVARLGVIGPTRMDYPGTMGAVRAVARYVGTMLSSE